MRRGGQITGIASLLTIFCALSLCVFSILTLTSAERERKFTAYSAERMADYYEAGFAAAEYVAALDPEELSEGESLSFSVPEGDTLTLRVEVRKKGGKLEILRWQTEYSGSWEPEDRLPVWSSNG